MAADGVELRAAGTDPDQLQAYARLLGAAFGWHRKFTPEALAWRYRDNPLGPVLGVDAWIGGDLAAHYVTCPTSLLVEGRPARALLSLNTATHPAHQGRSLFSKVTEAAYERAATEGYAFVIGVSNANSTSRFIGKCGFRLVAQLAAGFLARAPRQLPEAPLQLVGRWTPELLAWRLANPAARYRRRRLGAVDGVGADPHLPMVRCAAFLDGEGTGAPSRPPLGAQLWLGLDPRLDTRRLGFAPLPQRLRPSPLNLVYKPLQAHAPRFEAGAVAFNFLDFDPY
jgi:GNAT superfamily N-acetyltransferase